MGFWFGVYTNLQQTVRRIYSLFLQLWRLVFLEPPWDQRHVILTKLIGSYAWMYCRGVCDQMMYATPTRYYYSAVVYYCVSIHSVSREVLTPQISKMMETPIFRSGWVVGNTHYAQFCPIPSPHIYIFS